MEKLMLIIQELFQNLNVLLVKKFNQSLIFLLVWLLILNYPISKVTLCAALSFRAEAGFEVDHDVFTGLGTYVRCSKSKLSMEKATALYTWEIEGFIDYLKFLRDFGTKDFHHQTGNISFDSDRINGNWNFEISSNGNDNFITAKYQFVENSENENGDFGIQLRILQLNFENIDLPIIKPTNTNRTKSSTATPSPPVPIKTKKEKDKISTSYTSIFSYTSSSEEEETAAAVEAFELGVANNHNINTNINGNNNANTVVTMTFKWPSIPTATFLEFQNPNAELTFAFLIHGVFPKDSKILKKSSCNLDKLENKFLSAAGLLHVAPSKSSDDNDSSIVENPELFSMRNEKAFTSSRFADHVVMVENISIPVHGVIFYYSSPIAASLIENATSINVGEAKAPDSDGLGSRNLYSKFVSTTPSTISPLSSLPIIRIDDNIGYNATKEILRYIYTKTVDQNNLAQFADRIIVGAQYLQLDGLKSICEDYLIPRVTLKNVISNYVLGIDVNSNRIIRKAFAVIQANRAQIVSQSEEFRKLSTKYPNLMFELFVS